MTRQAQRNDWARTHRFHPAFGPMLMLMAVCLPTPLQAAGDLAAGICYQINDVSGVLEVYATFENTGTTVIDQGASYTVEGTSPPNVYRKDGTLLAAPHWELSPGEGSTSNRRLELPFAPGNLYYSLGSSVTAPQDTNPNNNVFTLFPKSPVSGADLRQLEPQFKCRFGTWRRMELTPWQGPSGGEGGSELVDSPILDSSLTRVSEIRVCAGTYVDSVQITHKLLPGAPAGLAGTSFPRHGGPGGTCRNFTIKPGDFVTRIDGRYGKFVTRLCLHSHDEGALGCTGAGGGQGTFQYLAPPGMEIAGFGGRAGLFVDAIGVIFRAR